MDPFLVILSVLGIFVASVFTILTFRNSKLPPGPWGVPVLGYLPWIDPKSPHLTLTKLSQRYGRIFSLSMGSVFTVVLTDQRLIRQAFAKDVFTGRAPLYLTHGIMKGYGLICAQGELWKDQRRFVTSSLKNFGMVKFGSRREKMEELIVSRVKECLQMLKALKGENADPSHMLQHCIGNTMNCLVFGKIYQEDDETWLWLQRLQEEGTKDIGVAGPLNFLPFLRFVPKFQKIMEVLLEGQRKSHALYENIIQEHKSKCHEDTNNLVDAFLDEATRRSNSEFYKAPQLQYLLADMFGAGLDTTMTTLRWFLLFMAANPSKQLKVQDELKNVLGSRLPTLEDIPQLPYTEAALAETQRIRSVVPVGIPHGALQDTELMGYRIPKGTMIVPLQWAVHMDSEIWPQPDTYLPERFISEDGHFYKPEAFIPFQTGKRMCVGDEMARMMMFLFGASIVHHFNIAPQEGSSVDLEGECGITLIPKSQKLVFTSRF